MNPDRHQEMALRLAEDGVFRDGQWCLIPCEADFVGFWPSFDPSHPIYAPLLRLPLAVGSTWQGAPEVGLVISGENARTEIGVDGIRWARSRWKGKAEWFLGTPWVDDPRALHVPHLYDYWGRLGSSRPARRRPGSGISWVASYGAGYGDLTGRRLDVARGLARWFPLAVPEGLRGCFHGVENVSFHKVPRTLLGKYDFISDFTFNLCFENSRTPGYLTEKPFDALVSGVVPVYEGDPRVSEWIDEGALIDCTRLDIDGIADRIREAERDGTADRVWEERENLVKVSLDEMVERVEAFVRRIEGEIGKPGRLPRCNGEYPREQGAGSPEDLDREALARITVVIKTILRPDELRATLESFRRMLGADLRIVVVDDSPEPDGGSLPPGVGFIPLPFDSGLSAGRNRGVEAAATEFVFIADDDNILNSTAREIRRCVELLDEGWDLIGNGAFGFEDKGEGRLVVARRPMTGLVTACDVTENFFIARRGVLLRYPWDEAMKVQPEHEDFFMRLREEGVKVGGSPLLRFENLASRPAGYGKLRFRNFMSIFRKRWGYSRVDWNKSLRRTGEGSARPLRARICLDTPSLDGWWNVGVTGGGGWVTECELSGPLPFLDDSLDFATLDSVLDRLDYAAGAALMGELFRALKPGGVLRIATLDLSFVLGLASEELSGDQEAFIQWATDSYLAEVPGYDRAFVINHLMSGEGRRFVHDFTTLADVLETVGFSDLRRVGVGSSDHAEHCGAEWLNAIPERFREMRTLVVEAVKRE